MDPSTVVTHTCRQAEFQKQLLRSSDVRACHIERAAHCLETREPDEDVRLAGVVALEFL